MIFNASIRNNNSREGIRRNLESNIIEILDMTLDVSKVWIKRKMIWESIHEPVFQIKLIIK